MKLPPMFDCDELPIKGFLFLRGPNGADQGLGIVKGVWCELAISECNESLQKENYKLRP